jgi:hypothetical protein
MTIKYLRAVGLKISEKIVDSGSNLSANYILQCSINRESGLSYGDLQSAVCCGAAKACLRRGHAFASPDWADGK